MKEINAFNIFQPESQVAISHIPIHTSSVPANGNAMVWNQFLISQGQLSKQCVNP